MEQRKTELLRSNERIRAQVDELKGKQTERRSDLVGYFATIKARMREPFLHLRQSILSTLLPIVSVDHFRA